MVGIVEKKLYRDTLYTANGNIKNTFYMLLITKSSQ